MSDDPHPPAEPDVRLRENVRLLGQLLGEILCEHAGPELFELVERVRVLAKAARHGDAEGSRVLRALLDDLETARAVPLARAFAHFLALANVAEQTHHARVDRTDADASPHAVLARIAAAGVTPDVIHDAVLGLRVELVLTSHPTQVARRTIRRKYRRLAEALDRLEDTQAPRARDALVEDLRREVTALWHTDELRRRRPTPVDEARAGLVLVEEILWDALPAALRALDDALAATTGRRLPLDAAPLCFASWMGGDRDGNPNVTPEVTHTVCWLSRRAAAELYLREIERLHDELSVGPCSAELRARVGDAREPYRAWLDQVRRRLVATRSRCDRELDATATVAPPAPGPTGDLPYLDAADLRADLLLCHASLVSSGLALVASGRLLDVLRRVAAFGTALVALDVRQDAAVHTAALDAVTVHLGLGSYAAWSEAEREAFLLRELGSRRPLLPREPPDDPALRDVLGTLESCARQGPGSLGAYVISMASRPSDVLAVYLLQREAGLREPLRVVPLFETLDALDGAPAVVARLLELPGYRERIGGALEVMVGYSDSGKDVGRFGAAWALYRTQEQLASVCSAAGVALTLFHGRGGTIARGGGPIYLAILSQPPHSVRGRLRVTIQGETIDSAFGLPDLALQSSLRYALATLETTLRPPAAPLPEWRAAMDRLAAVGASTYRRLVRETPTFVEYFQTATPAGELDRLNIGSRPARRRADGGIQALRAIPWIFAWTQMRLLVPGWLGVGEALESVAAGGDEALLGTMARDWPFFRSMLALLEMVLAKVDVEVAAVYDATLVPERLRPVGAELRRRCLETERWILRIAGQPELLASDPFLRRSIALRNPYVDPLNLLQAELIRRAREGRDDEVVDALLITVNGIAAGMRNTG